MSLGTKLRGESLERREERMLRFSLVLKISTGPREEHAGFTASASSLSSSVIYFPSEK